MTAPATLSLDGIAPPTCPTCGDTCLGPDGLDACQSCAERAELEYRSVKGLRGDEHAHPLVQQFFALADERRRKINSIADEAGIAGSTMTYWRTSHSPTVVNFEAALNTIGCRLAIVEIPTNGKARVIR